VDADGGSAVCLALYPNSDCTELCGDFEDAAGPVKIVCPVTEKDDTCPTEASGIKNVDTCVATAGETCPQL
jgi:hypothetical protein